MSYLSPSITASGGTWNQFKASGLSGQIEGIITANSGFDAAIVARLRAFKDHRGDGKLAKLGDLVKDFLRGDPITTADFNAKLLEHTTVLKALLAATEEVAVLTANNPGILSTGPNVAGTSVITKRGFTLTPGVATAGATTTTTAAATATDATGGTYPFTYQWYRSTTPAVLGTLVSGQTTKTLADTGLTTGTTYYYTLKYTDGASVVVYSNQITEVTA